MTSQEAKWAAQHDWWMFTDKLKGGTYRVQVRDDVSYFGFRYFESYSELRAWAGY